jgi:hypothetical protein
MPKSDIDYSNTIIYKITCTNPEIKDVYVGHTTNFVQRKHCHKQGCNNTKSSNYNCKLYKTIREKGGWDNWKMEIIYFFNCSDQYEARQKEQEYFISLNANLNSIEPIKQDKIPNHQTQIDTTQVKDICISKFVCEYCHYSTSRNSQYQRHILTSKHKNETSLKQKGLGLKYECMCGMVFGSRTTLWRHKNKCDKKSTNNQITEINNSANNTDLITYLINENKELKTMIMEVCKSNNKTF